jgi:diadenosine tetraphosphate (Ap4A) HIT family hydrolase
VAVAAVALFAAAAGQAWTFVVDHVLSLGGTDDPADHAAAVAISALLGLAAYPLSWRTLRTGAAGDTFRRFALFTVVCLALAVGVIAAATALFELISGILAGSFGRAGLHRLATWSGIAAIAFGVFLLHLAMLRRDRRLQSAAAIDAAPPGPAGCLVCARVAAIRGGANPTFIAATPHGYAVLGDRQYLRGYALLLWPDHVEHLHDLPPQARERFLSDMAVLGEAMWRALRPARLNYAIAGGLVPHLHAHVFPRWADEPSEYRDGPVGAYPTEIRDAPENAFDPERHGPLIRAIADELRRLERP